MISQMRVNRLLQDYRGPPVANLDAIVLSLIRAAHPDEHPVRL